jgi:hypothetical protein
MLSNVGISLTVGKSISKSTYRELFTAFRNYINCHRLTHGIKLDSEHTKCQSDTIKTKLYNTKAKLEPYFDENGKELDLLATSEPKISLPKLFVTDNNPSKFNKSSSLFPAMVEIQVKYSYMKFSSSNYLPPETSCKIFSSFEPHWLFTLPGYPSPYP